MARNPLYEQALEKQGVKWCYVESITIDSIDRTRSLSNQVRLDEPISTELVDRYAASMKEGYEFPAIVVYRTGPKSKFITLDGNHRREAILKNHGTVTDAYLVENTDPMVIDRLKGTFNNRVNGKLLSRTEIVQHAIDYVRRYGVTTKVAAKEWGLHEQSLSVQIRIHDARDCLKQHNIRINPTVTDEIIRDMVPLRTIGDDVFVKAVQAVSMSGANRDDAEDLVRSVKKAATLEGKTKVIDDFINSDLARDRKAQTKGGTVKNRKDSPRDKYVQLIRLLRNLTDDYPPDALKPVPAEFKPTREMAADVVERLIRMFGLGSIPSRDTTKEPTKETA